MNNLGWTLVLFGIMLIVAGMLWLLAERWHFWGRLPGDIRYEGKRITIYAPIMTCLLISALVTLILNVIFRLVLRK